VGTPQPPKPQGFGSRFESAVGVAGPSRGLGPHRRLVLARGHNLA